MGVYICTANEATGYSLSATHFGRPPTLQTDIYFVGFMGNLPNPWYS